MDIHSETTVEFVRARCLRRSWVSKENQFYLSETKSDPVQLRPNECWIFCPMEKNLCELGTFAEGDELNAVVETPKGSW